MLMDLVDLIVENREQIKAACARHGATAVRVFGSCARADYDEKSDIDVLVRFPESLKGRARERILKEAVSL